MVLEIPINRDFYCARQLCSFVLAMFMPGIITEAIVAFGSGLTSPARSG